MRTRTSFFTLCLTLLLSGPLALAEAPTTVVPAAVFFPVLPIEARPDVQPQLVPVTSNHPLAGDHAGLTRAVIVIHDFSRDAAHVLAEMTALLDRHGLRSQDICGFKPADARSLVKATLARRRGRITDEEIPPIVGFVLHPHGRPVVTYLGYARKAGV